MHLGPTRRSSRFVVAKRERAGGMPRWIVVVALVLAVIGALGYLRTWPPFATVMSASMAPTINTGDVVVLKRLDAPAAVGQVVMVTVPDEARARYGYPPVVIHRVAAVAADGTVTTKGDAKPEVDPFTVPRSAITKGVVTHVPAAGQVFGFLGSTLGLLWLASGGLMLFGMPLLDRYRAAQRRVDDEREEREHVIEELRLQVELLPGKIERAVANAVAALEPSAHVPAVPAGPVVTRLVTAAQFAAIPGERLRPAPAPPTPPATRPAPKPVVLPEPAVPPAPAPAPPVPPVPPSRYAAVPDPIPTILRLAAAATRAPRAEAPTPPPVLAAPTPRVPTTGTRFVATTAPRSRFVAASTLGAPAALCAAGRP